MASSIEIDVNLARALLNNYRVLDVMIAETAEVTYEKIIENISKENGSGEAYKRNGRVHVSSAPGAFPTKDTGELVGGIEVKQVKGKSLYDRRTDVLLPAFLTLALENGTSKMRPRPFVFRSINQALSEHLDTIINNTLEYFKGKSPRFFDLMKLGVVPPDVRINTNAKRQARLARAASRARAAAGRSRSRP